MQSPLISVIIPAYNASACIREALTSLLQQRFTHFEILVVDGASKDNTTTIVKEYAAQDKRVRFVSEKDAGIYDAMNKGVRLAAGEWLYFLGADDSLHDVQVLELVAPVLQQTNALFVYGNVLMGGQQRWYDGEFTYDKLLRKNISHQAIFYHRKVFSLVTGYNIEYKTHADWALNLNCFNQPGVTILYVNLLIAHFSRGGASSQHDVPFLREVLLPAKLSWLQRTGISKLKQLSVYDEWWRFFRNAEIRTDAQFVKYSMGVRAPRLLISMYQWQSKVSPALLKKGPVSKTLMFSHYIFNRLTARL